MGRLDAGRITICLSELRDMRPCKGVENPEQNWAPF